MLHSCVHYDCLVQVHGVLPHIDTFLEDGYTKEEQKMIDETRKILQDDHLKSIIFCSSFVYPSSRKVSICGNTLL
jgi:aspartate-semialdehyde dehydrogenase